MEESEDSYWQASKVKDSRKKRNIFDDDVTVEKASEIAIYKKSLHGDDGDDDDAIGWNDDVISPSTQINFQPKNRSEQQLQQQQQQQQPHNSVGGMGKLSLSQSPSLLTEPSLSTRVSEPSIAAVMDSGIPNVVSVGPQSSRQKDDEIQYLRTQLQNAEKALGVSKLKVEETVKRMILGQPFSLEQYRSKQEKLDLLDKAIATHDGNAIIAVVVFLKRTLKEQLFNLELMRRPVAVEQYLAYLKAHFNLHQYEHMLQLLGKAEDQAMLKLRQAVTVEDPVAKMDRLRTCQQAHFQMIPGLELDSGLIQQNIALLQRQRPVDVADDLTEKEGRHLVFRQKPRKASIINMPVITTLYYCCMYHYEEPDNLFGSPVAIRKEHQLTEKQFVWTAMRARASLHKWQDIDALFTTKGWFGGTKMKSVIGFHPVTSTLHRNGAPPEVLGKYLMLIDDVDRRLEQAHKLQCPDAVIETYQVQRNRAALEQYFHKLKPQSREWFVAGGVLKDQNIKWKA